MTRIEFLQQLRQALENDLSGSVVQENVDYYNQYISDEVRKGKSEEEVLRMLGDPWILARTVIDAQDGTDPQCMRPAEAHTRTLRAEEVHSRRAEGKRCTDLDLIRGGKNCWQSWQ